MSNTVKLSSKLPGNEEINGIDSIVGALLDEPDLIRVGVVFFDVPTVTKNVDSGIDVPTVRVRRLEPVGTINDVPKALRTIVDNAMEARTGRKPLPFDSVEPLTLDEPDNGDEF